MDRYSFPLLLKSKRRFTWLFSSKFHSIPFHFLNAVSNRIGKENERVLEAISFLTSCMTWDFV